MNQLDKLLRVLLMKTIKTHHCGPTLDPVAKVTCLRAIASALRLVYASFELVLRSPPDLMVLHAMQTSLLRIHNTFIQAITFLWNSVALFHIVSTAALCKPLHSPISTIVREPHDHLSPSGNFCHLFRLIRGSFSESRSSILLLLDHASKLKLGRGGGGVLLSRLY